MNQVNRFLCMQHTLRACARDAQHTHHTAEWTPLSFLSSEANTFDEVGSSFDNLFVYLGSTAALAERQEVWIAGVFASDDDQLTDPVAAMLLRVFSDTAEEYEGIALAGDYQSLMRLIRVADESRLNADSFGGGNQVLYARTGEAAFA
jgi:hypothetical protein